MQKKFTYNDQSYDVEYFHHEHSDLIRFYFAENEQYRDPLCDLVIVKPSCGYLLLQTIGSDAVLSGSLNSKYFNKEMTEGILEFLEVNFPLIKNAYLPYHIDFYTVANYDEYNGEY